MARRTREGAARMARLVNGPAVQCGSCGQRFWTYEQKNQHHSRTSSGLSVCLRVAFVEKPHPPRCGYCQDVASSLVRCPECG
jgi:hypothetical protein